MGPPQALSSFIHYKAGPLLRRAPDPGPGAVTGSWDPATAELVYQVQTPLPGAFRSCVSTARRCYTAAFRCVPPLPVAATPLSFALCLHCPPRLNPLPFAVPPQVRLFGMPAQPHMVPKWRGTLVVPPDSSTPVLVVRGLGDWFMKLRESV